MKWVDNVLVVTDGTLMTVLPDGTLEVRGDGWVRKPRGMSREQFENADMVRTCRLDSERQACGVAEAVARMLEDGR